MWRPEVMFILILIALCGISGECWNAPDRILTIHALGPLFRHSLVYFIPAVAVWAASLVFGFAQGLRAQRLPVKVGTETMLGETINALTPIDENGGRVFVEGEYWNAKSHAPVEKGRPVQITAIEGLTVRVKPEI
jgi:membrane-bound serine protease (ClpP class)